jgi:hypothetical protein
METFADTSALNAGVKEKNTKTNKRLSNSTVIFLPDVSDVWRRPNPVKPLNVHFFITKSTVVIFFYRGLS